MAQCPVCGAEVAAGQTECPKCGANVSGPTASFEAVGLEPPEAQGVQTACEVPVLVVRKGPQPGEKFFIDCEKLTIGRDPKSDIFLNDMTVSRTHAVIEREANVVTVSDSGSLNGTYVNGRIVERAVLSDGDVLQIGTFQMLYCTGTGAQ